MRAAALVPGGEYEAGHIPGAVLAPLPELTDCLDRIDKSKPVVVY